jgi:hypothetical protein
MLIACQAAFQTSNDTYTYKRTCQSRTLALVSCTPNPLKHVVSPRCLSFNDRIVLAVVVPHMLKYGTSDKVDDRKVGIPLTRKVSSGVANTSWRLNSPILLIENGLKFKLYAKPHVYFRRLKF